MEPRRVGLDTGLLKALAHPLRLRILGALRVLGASTASRLAERLGTSSGLTSYHLRALAAAGLVEEDPDRGTGRDRWWRAAHDLSELAPSALDETEGAPVAAWLLSQSDRIRRREVATWQSEQHTWPRAWRDASDLSDYYLLATADELRTLLTTLHDVLGAALATTVARRDGEQPVPDGAEHIRLHLLAFPVREDALLAPPIDGATAVDQVSADAARRDDRDDA